jgi:hypothetical protein
VKRCESATTCVAHRLLHIHAVVNELTRCVCGTSRTETSSYAPRARSDRLCSLSVAWHDRSRNLASAQSRKNQFERAP